MPLPPDVRASIPVSIAALPIGVTFGVIASPLLGPWSTLLMSAVVWSASAQFAALGVLTGGGSAWPALGAGAMTNARFLPLGFAIAPSFSGSVLKRIFSSAIMTDASFILARTPDGRRFSQRSVHLTAPLQYLAWVGGTAIGVLGSGILSDPAVLGLDVAAPVFFLALLLRDVWPPRPPQEAGARGRPPSRLAVRAALVAGLAAAVTLISTPVVPPGVPILLGALTACIGLVPPRRGRGVTP